MRYGVIPATARVEIVHDLTTMVEAADKLSPERAVAFYRRAVLTVGKDVLASKEQVPA